MPFATFWNFPSLLNAISNIAPLKKRGSLGSFNLCYNFDSVVSKAAVQYWLEYQDLSMSSDSLSMWYVLFTWRLTPATNFLEASLAGFFAE